MTHGVLMGLKTTSLIDNLLIQNRTIYFTKKYEHCCRSIKKALWKRTVSKTCNYIVFSSIALIIQISSVWTNFGRQGICKTEKRKYKAVEIFFYSESNKKVGPIFISIPFFIIFCSRLIHKWNDTFSKVKLPKITSP